MASRQRDSSVDLMRIVMMWLICLIHSVSHGELRYGHWLSNLACVGVVVFVLISGYFGITFTPSKVIRLEATGLFCAFMASSIGKFLGVCDVSSGLDYFLRYWFLHAYVVMMAIAALVGEKLHLDEGDGVRTVLPVLIVVFAWGFCSQVPVIQRFTPRSEGLDAFSGLTLFAIYIVGQMYRTYSLDGRLRGRWIWPIAALSATCVSQCVWPLSRMQMVFSRYNSPILLVLAICVFWAFRRIHVSKPVSDVLSYFVPSIFAVYLIHCNPVGYRAFDALEEIWERYGFNSTFIYLVDATIVFVLALSIDIPRRLLAHLFKYPIKRLGDAIDETFEKLKED